MIGDSDRRRHGARWRTTAVIAAMAVTGLLAAACGGGGSHSSGIGREFRPEPRSGSGLVRVLLPFGNAQGTETHQEFLNALKGAECMRSHGYPNWPDPNPNVAGVWVPTGVDTKSPQFQSAAKTCGVPMPPSG
jgi:hypothetical protein